VGIEGLLGAFGSDVLRPGGILDTVVRLYIATAARFTATQLQTMEPFDVLSANPLTAQIPRNAMTEGLASVIHVAILRNTGVADMPEVVRQSLTQTENVLSYAIEAGLFRSKTPVPLLATNGTSITQTVQLLTAIEQWMITANSVTTEELTAMSERDGPYVRFLTTYLSAAGSISDPPTTQEVTRAREAFARAIQLMNLERGT